MFASYVTQSAAFAHQRVAIELAGKRVTLVVRGKSHRGLVKSILDFAEACG
jgi:hypothetical protein